MKDMATFITSRIMEEAGKRLYKKWKDEVDTILETDGYDEVIVG